MTLLTLGKPRFGLGRLALNKGGVAIPSWVAMRSGVAALLDVDYANGKYWYSGQEYASEAELNTAALGVVSGIQRTYGPYVDPAAPNLIANGTFDTDASGWTGVNSGLISSSAGKGLVNGNNGANPGASTPVAAVAGKAYRMRSMVTKLNGSTALILVAANAAGSNAEGYSAATGSLTGVQHELVVGATAALMYPGLRITQSTGLSESTFENVELQECRPFAGLDGAQIGRKAIATTPATVSANNVLWQSGGANARNRVRLVLDTSFHLLYIGSYAGVDTFSKDLGALAPSTQFTVEVGAGPDVFWVELNGGPRVYAPVSQMPGIGVDWIGRSNATNENWTGTIQRQIVFAEGHPLAKYIVFFGDSFFQNTGASSSATGLTKQLRDGVRPPRRSSGYAQGGAGLDLIKANMDTYLSSDPGYADPLSIYLLQGGVNTLANLTTVNDVNTKVALCKQKMAEMVALLPAGANYVVHAVPLGNFTEERAGGVIYDGNLALNAYWSSLYGERFFDPWAAMIANPDLAEPQDAIDSADGIIPLTYRASGDNRHLGDKGYASWYTQLLAKLQTLGYVQ